MRAWINRDNTMLQLLVGGTLHLPRPGPSSGRRRSISMLVHNKVMNLLSIFVSQWKLQVELGTPRPLERHHQGPRTLPCSLPLWLESCIEHSLVTAGRLVDWTPRCPELSRQLQTPEHWAVLLRLFVKTRLPNFLRRHSEGVFDAETTVSVTLVRTRYNWKRLDLLSRTVGTESELFPKTLCQPHDCSKQSGCEKGRALSHRQQEHHLKHAPGTWLPQPRG